VDEVKAALTIIGAKGITISGKIGGGKIFVSSIANAPCIRSGERGKSAL
jgi:nitrogen regulatory protein PII